jgi:hypothetical protein
MTAHTARHLGTHVLLASAVLFGFLCIHALTQKTIGIEAAMLLTLGAVYAARLRRGAALALSTPRALAALVWTYGALLCAGSAAAVHHFASCAPCAPSPLRCVVTDFWAVHYPLSLAGWLIAGVPPRIMWFPEALNALASIGSGMAVAAASGELSVATASALLALAALRAATTPLTYAALFAPLPAVEVLLADVDTAPEALRPLRAAALRAAAALRSRLLGAAAPPLLDTRACTVITAHSVAAVAQLAWRGLSRDTLYAAATSVTATQCLVIIGSALARARGADPAALTELRDTLAAAHAQRVLAALRCALGGARGEAEAVAAGVEAISECFPMRPQRRWGCSIKPPAARRSARCAWWRPCPCGAAPWRRHFR